MNINRHVGVGILSVAWFVNVAAQDVTAQKAMTNAMIIQMVESKAPPDHIILAISKCNPKFVVDNNGAQELVGRGVPVDIINAYGGKTKWSPAAARAACAGSRS